MLFSSYFNPLLKPVNLLLISFYWQVKALPGLGTTIDVILVNGQLKEGDTIITGGIDGAIVTQIRSVLTPQPMRELRVKVSFFFVQRLINGNELTKS